MLDLSAFDLDSLEDALHDHSADEFGVEWLIDPATGQVYLWTSDTGIDGENPVDLDDLEHLDPIEPLPSWVGYRDMEDFVEGISDEQAARRLANALGGRGSFRRFGDAMHRESEEILTAWTQFRNVRRRRQVVEWLLDRKLVTEESGRAFLDENPDPPLP